MPDESGWLARAAGLARRAVAATSVWPAFVVTALVLLVARTGPAEMRRERVFDLMLAWLPRSPSPEIVIVDIDRASLAARGAWPWGRDRIAALIAAIADAEPRAIGLDALIDGPDERSPAALARRLADITQRHDIGRLADTLPDGDRQLALALQKVPTTLGAALDPEHASDRVPKTPLLVRGRVRADAFWHAEGVIAPVGALAEAASGLGVLLLPGDLDGQVRRAPLLVVVNGRLWPSLALEVVRSHGGASALMLSAATGRLEVAGRAMPVGREGMLRLVPLRLDLWAERTVPALDVLEKPEARRRLEGRIVLIGSSAPEVGGLRTAVAGPLVPSVALHAAAVEQILAGLAPIRNLAIEVAEVIALFAFCALGVWIANVLPPRLGILAVTGFAIVWASTASTLLWLLHLLVDPLLVPLNTAAAFTIAALSVATVTKRRETVLRRRFEQHLAPEVVSRLAAHPELLRLEGEMREITALFTDVEGFTAMAEKVDPRTLVGLLDRYFEGLTQIVVEHGGMVEKMVGDGLHAIFNAPLDLPEHPQRAVACAIAIRDFGERYRSEAQAATAGFGRTRVGIETGVVVVGDVGGGRKLDYTAHGEAMNMAARFEAANKTLGSSICIGPAAAARFPHRALRPLGRIDVRGRAAPVEVFDPWPEAMGRAERKAYLKAVALADHDPLTAADNLERIAGLGGRDPVPAKLAGRLRMVGITAQLADIDRAQRAAEPQPGRRGSKRKRR
jgi:adenylate cyclase